MRFSDVTPLFGPQVVTCLSMCLTLYRYTALSEVGIFQHFKAVYGVVPTRGLCDRGTSFGLWFLVYHILR